MSWLTALDILARLSIFTLPEYTAAFASLVKPLLSPHVIRETLVVILLNWAEPWSWVRQLRDWIRFLKGITSTLDEQCKVAVEETIKDWQQRRKGGLALDSGVASTSNVNVPLSQGEWDEPLGLPLCVVCHGVSFFPLLT